MSARFVALAAMLAVGVFTAAPAMAQKTPDQLTEAQRNEMMCVYDALSGAEFFYDIAYGYLLMGDVDVDSEEGKKLTALENTCATQHGWNADRRQSASAIAVLGVSSDVLLEEDFIDISEEQIDAIFQTMDEITDEDYKAFISGTWSENDALQTRVTTLFGENGFKVSEDMNYSGMLFMEVNIIGTELMMDWAERFGT